MGEFVRSKYAWMIPTHDGVVLEDDPDAPGMRPIYQIPVDDVESFCTKWAAFGIDFVPLYSGITEHPSPVVQTYKKKNERSK